jgi:hypothetical protein
LRKNYPTAAHAAVRQLSIINYQLSIKMKLLCRKVRYCFPTDVEYIYRNTITMLQNRSLTEITSETPPEYEKTVDTDTPGTAAQQTLSLTILHDPELEALLRFPIIILISTDTAEIVMGTKTSPCTAAITTDALTTRINITATSVYSS